MSGRILYARLAAIAPSMPTARARAAALGITVDALKYATYRARGMGFDIAPVEPDWCARSPRFASFDAGMRVPGCARCGLRGPHECVSAESMASFRSASYEDRRHTGHTQARGGCP